MKPADSRRLRWLLPLTAYALLLWRTLYGFKSLPIRVLDWITISIAIIAWAISRWKQGGRWPHTPLDGPLLAWSATTLVATVFSVNPRNSLHATWQIWTWAIILWALVDLLRRGWGSALWRALFLVGGVVFVISGFEYLSWYFGWSLVPTSQQGWPAVGGLADPFPPSHYRLRIALANATALSAFVALLIPPAITRYLTTRRRDLRIAIGLWLVVGLVIEFMSLSRGGWLALATSSSLLFLGATASPQLRRWVTRRFPFQRGSLALAILAAIFVLGLASGLLLLAQVRGLSLRKVVIDKLRIDLWRSAIEIFVDHPLTGVGPSAYGTALRDYRDPLLGRDHFSAAHNLYLNLLAETGVLGLLAGGAFLLVLAWTWWRQWRAAAPGCARWWRLLGVAAALVGLGMQSMVDTFSESGVVLPATFFIATIIAPALTDQRTQASKGGWRWGVAITVAMAGFIGSAWDDWGYSLFTRSVAQLRRGDVDRALTTILRARDHDPRMPLYACHAGYLYGLQAAEEDGRARAAGLEQYRDCTEIRPAGWIDQLNRAALLWEAGEQAAARASIEETTTETPREWLPWLNRGYWAEQTGDREDAVHSYGWVLSLNSTLGGSPFWRQGDRPEMWNEITVAAEGALAHRGQSREAIAHWRFNLLIAQGDWETAVLQIENWLEEHPADLTAMTQLSEALLGLNRAEGALDRAERAISAGHRTTQAYLARGEAALALGCYEEAEQAFRTVLFIRPNAQAHLGLARLYRATGEIEQSLEEYNQALGRNVVPHSYDLALYRRTGWSVPLPQVTQIAPDHHGEAALEWGALLEEEGNLATAQQVYENALAIDPFWDEIRRRLE